MERRAQKDAMEKQGRTDEYYYTVRMFRRLEGGFSRCCGPVAMTNLLSCLKERGEGEAPAQKGTASGEEAGRSAARGLFLRLAHLGMRLHIYWNMDLFGIFGGTSNFLNRYYLRRALRAVGLDDVEVGRRRRLTAERLEEEMEKGSLLYLQLMFHPVYGRHHLLCYAAWKEKGVWYLRLADGWVSRPRILRLEELGRVRYLPIRRAPGGGQ